MISRMILVLLALALLGAPAAARDLIPPGHKGAVHELVFDSLDLPEGQRLVATPVRGFGGVEEVRPGTPFRFSSKYGTTFYLVPRGAEVQPPGAKGVLEHPRCGSPVGEVSSVPLVSPVERVLTTLSFDGLEGDRLLISVVGEERFDSRGEPVGAMSYAPWIAALVLGIGFVVGLRKRRDAALS